MLSKRVDYGMSIVLNLLEDGIKPDDIILFGNCMGGHIAAEVHKKFKDEKVHLRCIVDSVASSFKQTLLSYLGFVGKLKTLLAPVFKLILKIFGIHWKTHKVLNSINPYTMCFNREGDETIKKQAQLVIKIQKIEQSGRKKDYQKKEHLKALKNMQNFLSRILY